MAFVFNAVEDALNNGGGQQGNNIFAGGGASGAQGAQGGNTSSVQLGPQGADTGSAGGAKSSGSNAQQATPDASAVASRNQNANAAGQGFIQTAQKSVQDTKNSIQSEADSLASGGYKGAGVQQVTPVSDEDYASAMAGNGVATDKIKAYLNGSAQQIKDPTLNTSTDIKNLQNLQTSAGRGMLLQKQNGPGYTQGDKALDEMLLKNSPQFNQIMGQLQQSQSDVAKKKADTEADLKTKAQDYANQKFKTEKDRLTNKLGGSETDIKNKISTGVDTAKAADKAAYAADIDKYKSQYNTGIQDQINKYEDLKKSIIPRSVDNSDAYLQGSQGILSDIGTKESALKQLLPNYGQYLTGTDVSNTIGNANTVTGDQATQFNAIEALLGKADRIQAGPQLKSSVNFNNDEFQKILSQSGGDLSSLSDQFNALQAASPLNAKNAPPPVNTGRAPDGTPSPVFNPSGGASTTNMPPPSSPRNGGPDFGGESGPTAPGPTGGTSAPAPSNNNSPLIKGTSKDFEGTAAGKFLSNFDPTMWGLGSSSAPEQHTISDPSSGAGQATSSIAAALAAAAAKNKYGGGQQ